MRGKKPHTNEKNTLNNTAHLNNGKNNKRLTFFWKLSSSWKEKDFTGSEFFNRTSYLLH